MSNWIRNSTKRRRVGPPKPRSQHTRVFNAQGIVSNACNMVKGRMKEVEFELEHARDANERVETFQRVKRDSRSLKSEESTRTRDPLTSKEDTPSKALTALDLLQRKDPTARRARVLQTVDLVGLNTRRSWKPRKPPSRASSTRPQLDKSRGITNQMDLPTRRALHSSHSRAGSESESHAQETIIGVDSPARIPALAHPLIPATQQPIFATSFSQDEILSMDLTFSQSLMGNGLYEQEITPFSDFLGHETSVASGHSSSLVDDTGDTSMAENDYTGQGDYLRATPQLGYWECDEGQHSDKEDMHQQRDEIPLLYPILYDRLGFPIVDRPLEYRLRLSGDRSGVGWPLKRWRGDQTDLLADETIDIGVALELDRFSSPMLWEETTTNSRGPYSRYLSAAGHFSSSYRFNAPREPGTTFSPAPAMVGLSDEEYIQEEDVVPFAYQLANDDEAISFGDAPEDDVEEIRCSPQSEGATLNYQGPGRTTEAYLMQCTEPTFDYSQEPTEAKLGDLVMEETMETEETIYEGEGSSEPQIGSIQGAAHGFVLAPDLFGD